MNIQVHDTFWRRIMDVYRKKGRIARKEGRKKKGKRKKRNNDKRKEKKIKKN